MIAVISSNPEYAHLSITFCYFVKTEITAIQLICRCDNSKKNVAFLSTIKTSFNHIQMYSTTLNCTVHHRITFHCTALSFWTTKFKLDTATILTVKPLQNM